MPRIFGSSLSVIKTSNDMEKASKHKISKTVWEKAFSYFYSFVPRYNLLITEKKKDDQQI